MPFSTLTQYESKGAVHIMLNNIWWCATCQQVCHCMMLTCSACCWVNISISSSPIWIYTCSPSLPATRTSFTWCQNNNKRDTEFHTFKYISLEICNNTTLPMQHCTVCDSQRCCSRRHRRPLKTLTVTCWVTVTILLTLCQLMADKDYNCHNRWSEGFLAAWLWFW